MTDRSEAKTWLTRVFGVQFAPGDGDGQPGGDAKRGAGIVQFRTLLLNWRDAQGRLAANIGALGKAVLARDDVKRDKRFADVQAAVAALPGLAPKFGGALEDILDRGLNAGPGAEGSRIAAEAIVAVDAYRKQLDGASALAALETLAAEDLKQDIPMHRVLDGALQDLRTALEKQV